MQSFKHYQRAKTKIITTSFLKKHDNYIDLYYHDCKTQHHTAFAPNCYVLIYHVTRILSRDQWSDKMISGTRC